jgi:hypothetical protein
MTIEAGQQQPGLAIEVTPTFVISTALHGRHTLTFAVLGSDCRRERGSFLRSVTGSCLRPVRAAVRPG